MDAIDAHLVKYPESPIVCDLFGTLDASAIRTWARELDPEADEIFFFAASIGALFGVRRHDGSRVAMKLHKHDDEGFLDDMQAVQAALAEGGFPAPRPLGRRGFVTWEEWLDDGDYRDAHEPEVRRALARMLADLVCRASAVGASPRRPLLRPQGGALRPKPHNALFDFEATADGAEAIDEIARVAKLARDGVAGREVVGHTDWGAKHVRFDDDLRPVALYDWDSLHTDTEARIVGNAMSNFVYTEEVEVVSLWPSPDEALAFLAEYEEARREPFTAAERRSACGAAVYLSAYGARCHWAFARAYDSARLEAYADALL